VELCGRGAERLVIDRLLAGARLGRSGVLEILGEPGIGKSALLEYAADAATGMRVLYASGVETEAAFAFAGLHMLLRPALHQVEALPAAQAAALRRAFGLAAEDGAGDPFLVGIAVLTLLSDLAEDQPVLCLIDDAHWLDAESVRALSFAARRLHAEGLAMIATARGATLGAGRPAGSGETELLLGKLADDAAADLLTRLAPALTPGLRARILSEADGNPLALTELARTSGQPGGPDTPGPEPLPAGAIGERFAAQLGALSAAARTLLLLGAAEPAGELPVIFAAARELGVDPEALAGAEHAKLVTVLDGRLRFRHPLLRTAAYYGPPVASRRAAHAALAAALDGALDGATTEEDDRRAWHLAAAATGRDEDVAAALERVAGRSRRRGGLWAAAVAYQRAAALTPEPHVRAARLLAAATAANDAGEMDLASRLASETEQLPAGDVVRARLTYLRARMPTPDRSRHVAALPQAAARIRGRAPELAVAMLTQATSSAWITNDTDLAIRVAAELRILLVATNAARPPSLAWAMTESSSALGDVTADISAVGDYLASIRRDPADTDPGERLMAGVLAFWSGDYAASWDISAALVAECRSRGMIGWLSGALQGLAMGHLLHGEWANAEASAQEGLRLAADTGQRPRAAWLTAFLASLAGYRGDQERLEFWSAEAGDLRDADQAAGDSSAWRHFGYAQLALAAGQFGTANDHLAVLDPWWAPGTKFFYQPDQVETAVRLGDGDLARAEAAGYAAWARRAGQRWALAVAARCRALVSDDATAAGHYEEALRLHADTRQLFEQARTHQLYGEWLRRTRHRGQARIQLAQALRIFEDLGADGFAVRARRELAATGAVVEQRPAGRSALLASLTAQELQVVRLAADGLSNRDIGAKLFLSPRTIGHHLYNAYPKLGVTSRAELTRLLRDLSCLGRLPANPGNGDRFQASRPDATVVPMFDALDHAAAWRLHGACRHADPDLFFAEGSGPRAVEAERAAKRVCAGCLVRRPCLEWALTTPEAEGVWGGTSPSERRLARQQRVRWLR